MTAPDVLLATCAAVPHGEVGHEALDAALAARGVDAAWAVWDDGRLDAADWAAAGLVHVRSTWDYQQRLPEFLAWARGAGPRLLHGADAFAWNTDKCYLLDLARRGLAVVATLPVADTADLREAADRFGTLVVKPRVGASGVGVHVVSDPGAWQPPGPGPWLAQPLLASVHDEGELSVFVIEGRAVSQVRKVAGPDDVRVHEEHGGTTRAVPLDPEACRLAVEAVAVTTSLVAAEVVCARIDLLRDADGVLLVSEVEITEPGLYLDVVPANADALADAVAGRLNGRLFGRL